MKEILVISGKGGTGKTSVTAALAYLWQKDAVLADCDVDAANLHLLMDPLAIKKQAFSGGNVCEIDSGKCTSCGKCAVACRFEAIKETQQGYSIDPVYCEGCNYCAHICPEEAINIIARRSGYWFKADTRLGCAMVYARLEPGGENSGKLVTQVKKEARNLARERDKAIIIVDGAPGTACPVIASLAGAHFILFVTEATHAASSDLKRVLALTSRLHIPSACIINKADLHPGLAEEIKQHLQEQQIPCIASIPFDASFTRAMLQGKTIMEEGSEAAKEALRKAAREIKSMLEIIR